MHKMFTIVLMMILTGCASGIRKDVSSSFIAQAIPAGQQSSLALEAAQRLTMLYPPAKTRLEARPAGADTFGQTLILTLREQGYAVVEANEKTARKSPPVSGLLLRYVLDRAGDTDLYQLTVFVGHQSITRPYLLENGEFVPAGYWAHKE